MGRLINNCASVIFRDLASSLNLHFALRPSFELACHRWSLGMCLCELLRLYHIAWSYQRIALWSLLTLPSAHYINITIFRLVNIFQTTLIYLPLLQARTFIYVLRNLISWLCISRPKIPQILGVCSNTLSGRQASSCICSDGLWKIPKVPKNPKIPQIQGICSNTLSGRQASGRRQWKKTFSFGHCPNYLNPPPWPQFRQLGPLFSEVEIQDLKVSLELKILYILYNILYICNLKNS